MELQIEGRHMDVTPAIQKCVEDKLAKLERYFDGIHRIHVILESLNKHEGLFTCEIICTAAKRHTFVAKAGEKDMYAAIDHAERRLQVELKKYKEKLHPHPQHAGKPEGVS